MIPWTGDFMRQGFFRALIKLFVFPLVCGVIMPVHAQTTPQDVIWTDLVNVTATGNSLQKTGGCDGCQDAGALSQQKIISGSGYLEFTVSETNRLRYIGLNPNSVSTSAAD